MLRLNQHTGKEIESLKEDIQVCDDPSSCTFHLPSDCDCEQTMEEDMTKFHEPPVARLSPTEGAAKMDALNAKLTRSALLTPLRCL